jgi:hypothetical protein
LPILLAILDFLAKRKMILQQFAKALAKFCRVAIQGAFTRIFARFQRLAILLSRLVCEKPIACAVQVQGESSARFLLNAW